MKISSKPLALIVMPVFIGGIFFSSTKRKMFSSTTIASSMTMPTISTSASIVTLLSVKSSSHIMPNVETTDAGMAMPAMMVLRQLRVKVSTTRQASVKTGNSALRCFNS